MSSNSFVVVKSCLEWIWERIRDVGNMEEVTHGKVKPERYRNARLIHTFEWFLENLNRILKGDLLQSAAGTTYLDAWT
jgi:hypothetical protein